MRGNDRTFCQTNAQPERASPACAGTTQTGAASSCSARSYVEGVVN